MNRGPHDLQASDQPLSFIPNYGKLFLIHCIYSMVETIKHLKVDNVYFFTSNSRVILRTGAVIELRRSQDWRTFEHVSYCVHRYDDQECQPVSNLTDMKVSTGQR